MCWAATAYRCDHDASVEVALSANLCSVETVQDFAWVRGEGCEDFGTGASHAHEADTGLWVCVGLAVEDEVRGVCLRLPA
jgi:hypothetical protein